MKVLYILWLRQIKRFFRNRIRIIGSLGMPMLFLVSLGFGLNPVFKNAGEGDYIQFLVPGIVAMTILFTAVFAGVEIIWDRQFGFLKETLVAPVSRLSIVIGRTLGGATIATLQGALVLALSTLLGFKFNEVLSFPLTLIFMFLIAMAFTSLGTAIASKLDDMQGFQLIMNFFIMPLFFLSGALFPLNGLPKFLASFVKINPLSYGVDGLRGVLISQSQFGITNDLLFLLGFTCILSALGSYLFSKIRL